jgi:pyrophosphatase PpaX
MLLSKTPAKRPLEVSRVSNKEIKKQAILFDLDGTLIDTKNLILASFQYATRTVLGKQVPDERVLPLIGIPLLYQMRTIDQERAEELTEVYRRHNAQVHDTFIRGFEGTGAMLAALRADGRQLAVVTSKRNGPAHRSLEHFDLSRFFDVVIGSDDTNRHKPDPEPLLVAAARLGVPITSCIYVGDSPYDMQAACAAGAVAVAALWGMFTRDELKAAGARYEAATPGNLYDIIQGIGQGGTD